MSPVSPGVVPCAASSLLATMLDATWARPRRLVEVARTRLSIHYETGRDDVPVLCVCTPEAVHLPASLVSPLLPTGPVVVQDGALSDGPTTWTVTRWWQPPRPTGLTRPDVLPTVPEGLPDVHDIRPHDLVGLGPGLTPSGDDVLAGALVAARATADPRLVGWRAAARATLSTRRTTAVSRALLHHALDGWAIPELAAFLSAVCEGAPGPATDRLLSVGHSSGAALAAGALHVLNSGSGALGGAA